MGRKKKAVASVNDADPNAGGIDPGFDGHFPDRDEAWVADVRARLVAWYREAGRKLPWREDRNPYRILVSEMMLVQTTVAAVVPFFHRFLERFPTARDLAEASEADVLKAWEGLGYYRRARQLRAAARAIVDLHAGTFPDDPETIRALPGVGRYIAGAILSFAFDKARADRRGEHAQRVLARWLAWREDRKWTRRAPRPGSGTAADAASCRTRKPGAFNQAFMELGALICTPRNPRSCLVVPRLRATARPASVGACKTRIPVPSRCPAAPRWRSRRRPCWSSERGGDVLDR